MDVYDPLDEEGTDLRAIGEGYIAVTPLQFDMTNKAQLKDMREWSWPKMA